MIGFQCPPSSSTSSVSAATVGAQQSTRSTPSPSLNASGASSASSTPLSSPTSSLSRNHLEEPHERQQDLQQANELRQEERRRCIHSPLAGHLGRSGKRSASPQQADGHQTRRQHEDASLQSGASARGANMQQVSSPGYHSAASSPSSSVSSSSACSSSGVSSVCSNVSSGWTMPTNTGNVSSNCGGGGQLTIASSSTPTIETSVSSSRLPNLPNLLDYFPELGGDGLRLSWFHCANNRARLSAAVKSSKMMIAGEISLAELSRYPVPIMARPPLGVSDITLENWLQEASQTRRGLKLTFTSTRTVEPAFRVLARHADQIKGPLVLAADILNWPTSTHAAPQGGRAAAAAKQQAGNQPVDAWTFLMLCRTRFPKAIISIGWCSPAGSSVQRQHPTLSQWTEPNLNGQNSPLLHSSAESMFELDIVDQPAVGLSAAGSAIGQRLQQLAASGLAGAQSTGRAAHPLAGSYPPLVHQLAAGASLHRLASNGQLDSQSNIHHSNHLSHHHHHILSSTGSLSSSSGNSSGSPSPTSPVGHLLQSAAHLKMAHRNQSNLHNLHQHHQSRAAETSEQLLLAAAAAEQQKISASSAQKSATGAWPAMAAAAALAAATSLQQTSVGSAPSQQLPLNLNINEADPQHATTLSDLAHKIHSLQQNSAAGQREAAAAVVLANKLLGTHQQHSQQQHWQHVSKKAALGGSARPSSHSPLPQAPSPSHRHSATAPTGCSNGGSLLCVKTSQQQQGGAEYSREMLDRMASLVKEYNLTQPVTFPVEAKLMRNDSLNELQRLLYQVGANSTLTVVAQQDDLISVDDLIAIRKHFSPNQLLFDLPDELAASLRQELELL